MNDSFQVLTDFVIKQIEQRLDTSQDSDIQLRKSVEPEVLSQLIDLKITESGYSETELKSVLEKVIAYSVNTQHPYFMNQMFGKMQPVAFLADILISVLNTSMYTYEVAPVLTLMEKETIGFLASKIWGEGNGDGVFTSGGSMSNMKAMLLARQNKLHKVKSKGLFTESPVAIFVSEQAHYSFTKGVNFMGFGTDALVKVKSDENARMDISALKREIEKAREEGKTLLMLTAIAGTTISGTFDPVEELSEIAKEHNMWFHVDAAFGGALLFSDKDKKRLKGIEQADSVSWNFHKAMGMPLTTSTFLTKNKGDLNEAFHVNADYLFHQEEDDYDLGQKSIQGGRRAEVLKLWTALKYEGETGFQKRIETLREHTRTFTRLIEQTPSLELFQQPDATIVCFRYTPENMILKEINELNIKIREAIFNEGKIILNYAPIHDKIYLRCVLLDPAFTVDQLNKILQTVLLQAEKYHANVTI